MRAIVLLGLMLPLVVACRGGPSAPSPTGVVQPTVSGVAPPTFGNLDEGRRAFTRACGSLTAVLEDASWLAFEGDPSTVEANHRAYFQYGYTTFQVELRSKEFTQPTQETFLLEDSAGRRIPGQPICFAGSPVLVDDRYFSRFQLSFQHTISRDLQWIRLTRVVDGSSLEWTFAHGRPAAPRPRTASR